MAAYGKEKKKHGCLRLLVAAALAVAIGSLVFGCNPLDSAQSAADEVKFVFSDSSENVSSDRLEPETHPYYALLTEDQQDDYERILGALLEGESRAKLSGSNGEASLEVVIESVLNDHPDIFWVGSSYSMFGGDTIDSVEFTLLYEGDDLTQRRAEFDEVTQGIIEPLKGMSTEEREKAVFDYLSKSVAYDENTVDNGQGAYSALVDGKAVCAGYSRAFQHLMLSSGDVCLYVTGQAYNDEFFESGSGGHAWNLIEIDGKFYNVDATWGDSTVFDSEGVIYQDFNVSDAELSDDHERSELSSQLPACESEFDFKAAYGVDPAQASLESAGFTVDSIVASEDEFVEAVVSRGDELSSGSFTLIAVARNMDSDQLSEARSAALDGLLEYADPGQSVSVSGTIQQYSNDVLLVMDEYVLN